MIDLAPIRQRRMTRKFQALAYLQLAAGLDTQARILALQNAGAFLMDADVFEPWLHFMGAEKDAVVHAAALGVLWETDFSLLPEAARLAEMLLGLGQTAMLREDVLLHLRRLMLLVPNLGEALIAWHATSTHAGVRALVLDALLAHPDPSESVRQFFLRIFPETEALGKQGIIQRLARLGALPVATALLGLAAGQALSVRWASLLALEDMDAEVADEYIRLFRVEKDWGIRQRLLAALAERFVAHHEVVALVMGTAFADPDPQMRRAGLAFLARWTVNPDLRSRMMERLLQETQEAQLLFLVDRIQSQGESASVRETLLRLAEGQAALSVRCAAIQALSPFLVLDEPATGRIRILLETAGDDRVMMAAAAALKDAMLAPEVRLRLALQLAQSPRTKLRAEALQHFLRMPLQPRRWPELFQAFSLLADTQLNPQHRIALAQGLSRSTTWQPEQMVRLRELSQQIDLPEVRAALRHGLEKLDLAVSQDQGAGNLEDSWESWARQMASEHSLQGIFPIIYARYLENPDVAAGLLKSIVMDPRLHESRYQLRVPDAQILGFLLVQQRVDQELAHWCLQRILQPPESLEYQDATIYLTCVRFGPDFLERRAGLEKIWRSPEALYRLHPETFWETWCVLSPEQATEPVEAAIQACPHAKALETYWAMVRGIPEEDPARALLRAVAARRDLLSTALIRDIKTTSMMRWDEDPMTPVRPRLRDE